MKNILLIMALAALAMADIGKVTVVKGDAFVYRDVKTIKARNAMPLLKEDVAETRQGRMQMHFIDNTVISLGKESRFVIKEYLYDDNTQQAAATFKIEKGFIKTITGSIGKKIPELFVLETAATTVRPHGTIWSVMVDENSEDYNVIEGSISLTFNDGQEQNIELAAGESMRLYIDTDNKSKVAKSIRKSLRTTGYEKGLEHRAAKINEELALNKGTTINDKGEVTFIDDGNNGHGNDPDGVDPSNPGQSKE